MLATGGLVLYRAPAAAFPGDSAFGHTPSVLTAGKNSAAFAGPGAHGMVSLSHSRILSGTETALFADVRVVADADARAADQKRAPISLAVVLDTSGSMSGEKIEEARRSVLRLLADMRDDDEIAVIRYSDSSEVIQPLVRVGVVRESLAARIRQLEAGGGTNIPSGMSAGLHALDESARGRVRRIILVSDGLDSTRLQAEGIARSSFAAGITVSSLGIGLDFDESYMGSLAQNGHGNFAFVKDGASLAKFLHRELEETAGTTVENARVRLQLPPGMRFIGATGADAAVHGSEIELVLGSLFGGDERRVIVELAASTSASSTLNVETQASWSLVGGGSVTTVRAPQLTLLATSSPSDVESGQDGAVLASATSVVASRKQIEASNAYAQGNVALAAQITDDNERSLARAKLAAPQAAATALDSQMKAYGAMKRGFTTVAPTSAAGKAAAKQNTEKDLGNFGRSVF
ncbi:MAG TPA: VWA domain-containing protein [Labilithrix sp.]|nr:VWA domain-containing protein [Labilithrix sp.]